MCVWLTPQTDQTQFRACRILHSPHSALVGGIHVCMTTSRSLCVPSFSKISWCYSHFLPSFLQIHKLHSSAGLFFHRLAKTYIQPPAVLLFLNIISEVPEHYDPYLIPYNMIWSDALEWLWTRDINLWVGMWAAGVFAVATNDQRLRCFFWDYLRCRPLPQSALQLHCLSERGEYMQGFSSGW